MWCAGAYAQTVAPTESYKCKNRLCTHLESLELASKGTFKIKGADDAVRKRTPVSSGTWVTKEDTLRIKPDNGESLIYVQRKAIYLTFLVNVNVSDKWEAISNELEVALKADEDYKELSQVAIADDQKEKVFYSLSSNVARKILYEKPSEPYDVYIPWIFRL
jgi:hypothetical protein